MTLIPLSQDPELDSHLPLPGQGWLLQVSHLLRLQHSSNSPWQRLSKILLQHHCTKIISLRLQKAGSGGVCSQIIQRMIFACLGSSCHTGVHQYSQGEMLPGLCRQWIVPSQECLFAVPASGLWRGNVKPWHSSLFQSSFEKLGQVVFMSGYRNGTAPPNCDSSIHLLGSAVEVDFGGFWAE